MIRTRHMLTITSSNFVMVPIVYFLFPETGCRSLEEVDVLFHHASQTSTPWTSVVKVAKREPLWYGKDGESPFLYEQSEWHARFARLSGETVPSSNQGGSSGSDSGGFGQEQKI